MLWQSVRRTALSPVRHELVEGLSFCAAYEGKNGPSTSSGRTVLELRGCAPAQNTVRAATVPLLAKLKRGSTARSLSRICAATRLPTAGDRKSTRLNSSH